MTNANQKWIGLKVCPDVLGCRLEYLRDTPGHYVFVGEGKPIYVGKSKDIARRLQEHMALFFTAGDGSLHTKWGHYREMFVFVRMSSATQRDLALIDYRERKIYGVLCALAEVQPSPIPGFIGIPPVAPINKAITIGSKSRRTLVTV